MRTFDNRFQLQQTLTQRQSPKRRCAYEIVKNITFWKNHSDIVTWRADLGTDL